MKTVQPGESLKFRIIYSNEVGDRVDPPEVTFHVYKRFGIPTYGPLSYDGGNGEVVKLDTGIYEVELSIFQNLMPGIYTAQWEAEAATGSVAVEGGAGALPFDGVEGFGTTYYGDARFDRVEFQVMEFSEDRSSILDPPRLHGSIKLTSNFNDMGLGNTSQLFIVGHCSGLTLNEPYQIANMQEAINIIGANQYSPMVRYIMEAHNAGARDIWIMPAATEAEYIRWDPTNPEERFIPRPELGGDNFYEHYYPKYVTALETLAEYDFPDIIVAPDAPLYDTRGIDFLGPLISTCIKGFHETGRLRLGLIGTLTGMTDTTQDYEALVNFDFDSVFASLEDEGIGPEDGKIVSVVYGEGTMNVPGIPLSYTNTIVNSVAATLSRLTLDRGMTYQKLPGVVAPTGKTLSKEQIRNLANHRVNPVTRTAIGKRGQAFNAVVASDNSLAVDGSDFWSLTQMRLVLEVVKHIRALGLRNIGTVEYRTFKRDVSGYLDGLVVRRMLRDYKVDIGRRPDNPYTIRVDLVLRPFFGVREIVFGVEVNSSQVVDNPLGNAV